MIYRSTRFTSRENHNRNGSGSNCRLDLASKVNCVSEIEKNKSKLLKKKFKVERNISVDEKNVAFASNNGLLMAFCVKKSLIRTSYLIFFKNSGKGR